MTEKSKRRIEIKVAKRNHNESRKNRVLFNEERKFMINSLIAHDAPNWGGLVLTQFKY